MTDVSAVAMTQDLAVLITIRFDSREPPSGRVCLSERELSFVGWLGLLKALSELLDSPAR
ncbi:MAG: hypothetical protein ACRDI1_07220 [Actinomycetota bacterium]